MRRSLGIITGAFALRSRAFTREIGRFLRENRRTSIGSGGWGAIGRHLDLWCGFL